MATLINNQALSFKALKEILSLTDGNLAGHLKKLEDAHYVEIHKSFEGKRPKTTISISDKGKDAFREYIQELQQFMEEF